MTCEILEQKEMLIYITKLVRFVLL